MSLCKLAGYSGSSYNMAIDGSGRAVARMTVLSWEAVITAFSCLYTGTTSARAGFVAFTANHDYSRTIMLYYAILCHIVAAKFSLLG